VKLIGSGGMTALRRPSTLFVFAMVAGLSSSAACTSGTTADCSPDAGGNPNQPAWCGVPAGEGGESEGGAMDAAPEAGHPETGAPEAAVDAPPPEG
jgi:hypothetical protein